MPKSKKSTEYLFVLPGINTEKIDTKYNLFYHNFVTYKY
jgi:hypothetical protein